MADEKGHELACKLLEERTNAFNKFLEEHIQALKQVKNLEARQLIEFDLFEILLATVLARQPFLVVDKAMRSIVEKAAVVSLVASQRQPPGFDPSEDGRLLVVIHDEEEIQLQKQELADPQPEAYRQFGSGPKGEA